MNPAGAKWAEKEVLEENSAFGEDRKMEMLICICGWAEVEGRISGRMVYFWVLAPYRRNLHSPPFPFYPYPCLVARFCLVRKFAFLSGFPVNCAPVHPLSSYLHTRCAVEACVNEESCLDWLSGTAVELSLSYGSRKQR